MTQGGGFSHADRLQLFNLIGELIQGLIPRYRKLAESGQIELSTTPHYHPLAPLLIVARNRWRVLAGAAAGIIAFAGIYELWRDESVPDDHERAWLWTAAIITTQATDDVGQIHDRMPMVITPEHWADWLDPGNTESGQLQAAMLPASANTPVPFTSRRSASLGMVSAFAITLARMAAFTFVPGTSSRPGFSMVHSTSPTCRVPSGWTCGSFEISFTIFSSASSPLPTCSTR